MRAIKIVFAVVVCLVLTGAGCSDMPGLGVVNVGITTFQDLPPDYAGKKFTAVALRDQSGPEFETYSKEIIAGLVGKGLIYVNTVPEADYVMMFGYGMDNGRQEFASVPVYGWSGGGTSKATITPAYGPTVGRTYTAEVENPSTYGVVGQRTVANMVYRRALTIRLADRARSPNPNEKIIYAYEGRAVSEGSSGSFLEVSKCMIDALIKDFPGVNARSHSTSTFAGACAR